LAYVLLMFIIDFWVVLRCFQIHQFTLFLFAGIYIIYMWWSCVTHGETDDTVEETVDNLLHWAELLFCKYIFKILV